MKRYYENSYVTEFETVIEKICGNKIYLEDTYFYPASGGQLCDTGTINGLSVVNVCLDEDHKVIHFLEDNAPFQPGESVKCAIDWERRFDFMQQHSGQHLISGILDVYYQIYTKSFHMGMNESTIDVQSAFPINIDEIEDMVNKAILNAQPIATVFYNNLDELGQIHLRKPPKMQQNIRVVSIGDLDATPCGGTHLRNTSELQLLKITRVEAYKGGYRISFVFGKRALNLFAFEHRILHRLVQILSVPVENMEAEISRLTGDSSLLKKEIDEHKRKMAGYLAEILYHEAEPVKKYRLLTKKNDVSAEMLRLTAQYLIEKQNLLVFIYNNEGHFVLASSINYHINLAELVQQMDWKGGGSESLLQGVITDNSQIPAFIICLKEKL